VLDALGHADVPVPQELPVPLMPGVVPQWRVRIAPAGQTPLNERLVAALEPEAADWTTWTLPERGPAPRWWLEQERKRGFALSLDRGLGKALVYQGAAFLQADSAKRGFLHTGGHLQSVWLNGHCTYRSRGWTGWHAGKERVPVWLRGGRNVLVIESSPEFFLSVTDAAEMPQERPRAPRQQPG
jgi:hypothetical protein